MNPEYSSVAAYAAKVTEVMQYQSDRPQVSLYMVYVLLLPPCLFPISKQQKTVGFSLFFLSFVPRNNMNLSVLFSGLFGPLGSYF